MQVEEPSGVEHPFLADYQYLEVLGLRKGGRYRCYTSPLSTGLYYYRGSYEI
jgi:hypothetical protein